MPGFLNRIKSFSLQTTLIGMLIFCLPAIGQAQNDTLRLSNNDLIVGEVKLLAEGIITIKTPYSDQDFKIEFNKVRELIIDRKCLIVLSKGRRRFGNIRTNEEGQVVISLENNSVETYSLSEVNALQEVEDNFWHRFKGAIDLGFNLTKANNNRQFNIGGKLDYKGEFWQIAGTINTLNSNQDNAEKTKRTDANLELIRLMPKEWYLLGEVSFLSNTEQALDARISPSLGLGKLLKSTNKLYLGLSTGLTYNIENYVDATLNKTSLESFIGFSFKMFGFKDIDLVTGIQMFPSLSEKGRFRTDYDFTLKYDLPLDFYIKLGFTFNYDNQPAIIGNDFDYIFTSGFGWDFD